RATHLTKPGQKGGDVRFVRVKRDLETHLKQRADTYVTLFVDYYGIKSDWPGLSLVRSNATPAQIFDTINKATKATAVKLFAAQRADKRFIPNITVHEFEALLFSDPNAISIHLGISVSKVKAVLKKFGEPEAINNNPETAPSKRLDAWAKTGKFAKTTTGIAIARDIGIRKIRKKCPLFNKWLQTFEEIQAGHNG
ncbi:MAG: DUF4276 family protein, partial [Proteobacteria bacterium]|nr:DUF4276 family protein [Pseudomonadota bacterium]